MEEKQTMVEVRDVTMNFNLASEKVDNIKEYFIRKVKGQLQIQKFVALDHISLDIYKGDVFGIVGLNGAGKSTLLKVVSGILAPSEGSVTIHGSIAPLIELGAGFDMDLTARENVFLNGTVLGYSPDFLRNKYDGIIDFAELQNFQDVPIKNFSSGMLARLAFSIATMVTPDILIVDEILSVGDFLFQAKCEDRINHMLSSGTTVIMVSHSIDQIQRMCNRVVWLDHGHLKMIGEMAEVCEAYKHFGG